MGKPDMKINVLIAIREAQKLIRDELLSGSFSAPKNQLEQMLFSLDQMELQVMNGLVPPKVKRDRSIGKQISDSWPLGTKLGEVIVLAENLFHELP
jgi:hypothetical protein